MSHWDNHSDASAGWSVCNIMRRYPLVTTKAAVFTTWHDFEQMHNPAGTELPSSVVDRGVAYLVAAGFATYNAGTDVITATHLDSDGSGRPARLRRKPTDEYQLEILPAGATPKDGT